MGRDTEFDKVSGKLDTDLIQEIRMKARAAESGGKFKGKGKSGKKDKGKGKNAPLDQGTQMVEWKPEPWRRNNWSEKGQQKGYGKKGKMERKGKEWRAPSPQHQSPSASSQFDNKSTVASLGSLRAQRGGGGKRFLFCLREIPFFLCVNCVSFEFSSSPVPGEG